MSGQNETEHKKNILWGYNVFSETMDTLVKHIDDKIKKHQPFSILSLNTLKLHQGEKNKVLKEKFTHFDCIIPDGQSIALASSLLNGTRINYISGMELMIRLIGEADKKNYSLYFLGSPEALLDKVRERIQRDFPGIKKHYYQHGYYDIKDEEDIVRHIAEVKPDILFIAFGSPRKEEFIDRYYDELNAAVMMGVGGSYEVFTGEKKLDSLTKKLGLRWFVRMLQDPRRLAGRYAVCNSHFLWLIFKEKFGIKKS